jgi:hypothetical protein
MPWSAARLLWLLGEERKIFTLQPHLYQGLADIVETVVAGTIREIAIARDVGDSVLYHSESR